LLVTISNLWLRRDGPFRACHVVKQASNLYCIDGSPAFENYDSLQILLNFHPHQRKSIILLKNYTLQAHKPRYVYFWLDWAKGYINKLRWWGWLQPHSNWLISYLQVMKCSFYLYNEILSTFHNEVEFKGFNFRTQAEIDALARAEAETIGRYLFS